MGLYGFGLSLCLDVVISLSGRSLSRSLFMSVRRFVYVCGSLSVRSLSMDCFL